MPWTVADVEKHKSGLTDEEKTRWVSIANGALAQCEKKGGQKCDVHAIMIANAAFSLESAAPSIKMSVSPIPEAMAFDQEQIQSTSEFQTVFPIGIFQTEKYGEIVVTKEFCQQIVDNWKNKVLGNAQPFLDVEHNLGESQAWIEDMRVTDAGLQCKFNWTEPGKDKIRKRLYRYFSAYICAVRDLKTGKRIYPVLQAVALTNTPVMNVLQDVKLSDNPTPGDGKSKTQTGGPKMDFTQLIEWLKANKDKLTPEQIKALVETIGVSAPTEDGELAKKKAEEPATASAAPAVAMGDSKAYSKVTAELEAMRLSNEKLTQQVHALSKKTQDEAKKKLFDLALSTGRILPVERPKWEQLYDQVPEKVEELILAMPLSKHVVAQGTSGQGPTQTPEDEKVDAEALSLAKGMGISAEQYAELSKSMKKEA